MMNVGLHQRNNPPSETKLFGPQYLTMSTDFFYPTYCAMLWTKLNYGDDAFEVALDTG
jgi:hypothetical protein